MSVSVPDKINVLWFLPTHGDSRYLGTQEGGRAVDLSYLRQIAQAADSLGYFGVLLPTGRSCEDSWVVASALAPVTEAPVLRASAGRLLRRAAAHAARRAVPCDR